MPATIGTMQKLDPVTLVIFHTMWEDLHSKQDADSDWFSEWLDRLSDDGPWLLHAKDVLRVCPVDYDNFNKWASEFHDCMSFAIGKRPQKRLSIEHNRGISRIAWSKSKGGRTGICGGCVQRRVR